MRAYKLTDQNSQTQNNTQWGENVTHEAQGDGPLCTAAWLHFYRHPLLAILHNPMHANLRNPLLWKAEAEGEFLHKGFLKGGCKRLTTIKQIEIPTINTNQKIAYAILCTKQVCKDVDWNLWADNWLSGKDRVADTARAAADAAAYAAYAAADAAAYAAATRAAVRAAAYAADIAYAAAYAAADTAAYAADAAADIATRAAARAAAYAAYVATNTLNLIELAEQAMLIN